MCFEFQQTKVSRHAFQQCTALEGGIDFFLICNLNTRATKDAFSVLLDIDASDFAKCLLFLIFIFLIIFCPLL